MFDYQQTNIFALPSSEVFCRVGIATASSPILDLVWPLTHLVCQTIRQTQIPVRIIEHERSALYQDFQRRKFRDFTFPEEMEKYPVSDYSPIVQAISRRHTPIEGLVQGSMEASAIPGGACGGSFF